MTGSSASTVAQTNAQPPAAPTNLTAVYQGVQGVLLAWTDNATTETGFVVQRCAGAGCTNFVQIAPPPPIGTNSVTYTDATVALNTTYRYRVAAVNGTILSGWSNIATVVIPNVPAAPSNVTVDCARLTNTADRCTLRWVDNSNNETGFTVQRSRNANFQGGDLTTFQTNQNVTSWAPLTSLLRNQNYYFRVRARNGNGPSAWVNAVPFPIRTP
jgi:hypothetical protein